MFLPWRASPEDRSNKTLFDCGGGRGGGGGYDLTAAVSGE